MTRDDYGPAPLVAKQAVRFLVPSLGDDAGGRVFTFASLADLHTMQRYYVELGRASALLFSHVFANVERLVLVQINGDLPDSRARGYRRAVAHL